MRAAHDPAGRRRYSRAEFLARAGAAGAALAATPTLAAEAISDNHSPRPGTKVQRWAVVTIGNLSRNRYWGESDAKGIRSAICTCTLIEGADFRLLVDPSLPNADEMTRELDRRTGLKPGDITATFITHEHADHYAGLAHFPNAKWFASVEVASLLNATKKWSRAIEPAAAKLFDAIDVVPAPGHTMGLNIVRFDFKGRSVAVVGDAVATEDFWRERRGYFNCVDFDLSAKSMDKIAILADIVVPGHDNYFLVSR